MFTLYLVRYQLQRLYSRAYIAGRLDLLQVAQEWAAVEYPEPLDRWSRFYIPPNRHNPDGFTQQTQHRDALVAVSSAGFSSIPDLVLLQLLAFARLLPRGLEYLLDQAIEGGWAVEDDACLSCMMTLKKAYGLSPSATLCGRSLAACTSSAAVTGSFRYYIEYGDHRSGPMDSFVPETDGVHALLAKALFEGDALAVNRLIAFGASSRPERTPTISAAANEETLDDGLFAVPAADEGARATRRRLQAMDVSCENFAVSNPYLCASEILERYYYDRHADKSRLEVNLDPFDAVQIAAMSTKVSLLRPLLELGLREGRWDTEQGRNDLRQCLKASRNSIECYDLIQNYASEKPDPVSSFRREPVTFLG